MTYYYSRKWNLFSPNIYLVLLKHSVKKINRLLINIDKTECMIFNKTGRLFKNKFHLNGIELEKLRSYKYLGFTPSGEIKSWLHDLRDRTFMKFRNHMGTSFNQSIHIALDLFDTMIKPLTLQWWLLGVSKTPQRESHRQTPYYVPQTNPMRPKTND